MATRSSIILNNGETRIVLYRHYDGYPSVNGRDLANIMVETVEFNKKYESEMTSDGTVIETIDDDFREPIQFFLEKLLSHDGDYRIQNFVSDDSEYVYEIGFLRTEFTFRITSSDLEDDYFYFGGKFAKVNELIKKLNKDIKNGELG